MFEEGQKNNTNKSGLIYAIVGVKIEAKDCESIDSLTAEFEPYEGDLDPQLIMDGDRKSVV